MVLMLVILLSPHTTQLLKNSLAEFPRASIYAAYAVYERIWQTAAPSIRQSLYMFDAPHFVGFMCYLKLQHFIATTNIQPSCVRYFPFFTKG